MAIASKGEHITKVLVKGIVLRLSMEEAQALIDVLENIGGVPHLSRRGRTESVRDALVDMDGLFSCSDGPEKYSAEDLRGSITFRETK